MPEANLDRCDSCGADLTKVARGRIASGPGAWCAACEADLNAYMKLQATKGLRPKAPSNRREWLELPLPEDNHGPGNARHFWLPVDPAHRVACECKVDEQVFVDPDGYRWSNPIDDEYGCTACEIGLVTGKPCPVHPSTGEVRHD